jgi:hypothetical protein
MKNISAPVFNLAQPLANAFLILYNGIERGHSA